ncbi:hypothetical protein NQZ68_025751 [Dissostichus eleginoides]|nr:hypothetical protein NQZ68_025751 [Dissostichus eleginoides]
MFVCHFTSIAVSRRLSSSPAACLRISSPLSISRRLSSVPAVPLRLFSSRFVSLRLPDYLTPSLKPFGISLA